MRYKELVAIFILLLLPLSFADGMIHYYDYYWRPLDEDRQYCAINYQNGLEKMILTVSLSDIRGTKAVWIFPVPAKPKDVAIDIIKGFPALYGYDVKGQAEYKVEESLIFMSMSQIYPILFPFLFVKAPHYYTALGIRKGAEWQNIEEGVTVHERIEKMGLVTELVTAESGDALSNYLTNKGLDLPSESKEILDEYVGKEYSFVISWISDVEEFKRNQEYGRKYYYYGKPSYLVGVSITFPTSKIYFPLKPTSIYGSREIPITIFVMDHVTPEIYEKIKPYTTVGYYIDSWYSPPYNLESFFGTSSSIRNLKYTKIVINAPSKYLENDLWIKNYAPANVALASFIVLHPFIFSIFLFIIASCLASGIAGFIIFRDKKMLKKLTLWGLFNFLSIIGFSIATLFMKTKPFSKELVKKLKKEGAGVIIFDLRKLKFIGLFSILFLVILFIFGLLFSAIF